MGSVKRCKNPKCNRIFYPSWNENRSEYCETCRIIFRDKNKTKNYEKIHERYRVGNSKQNKEILAFLKKKRANEDKKYANIFKN